MIKKITTFLKKYGFKITFFLMGLGSLIWFLIRVIPKPSRAMYPCMKAAAPIASSFLAYVLGFGAFTLLMRKVREQIKKSKYLLASVFLLIGLLVGFGSLYQYTKNSKLKAQPLQGLQEPNNPYGVGVGIMPGRVAWIHDPDAIDENCPNSNDDYWYMNNNTDQDKVNKMLSDGLQVMTGKSSDSEAWDAMFKYFNNNHGKGEVGYQPGEKFVIKINLNGVWGADIDANINTSPQICYAILDQLVNVVGVNQSDISLGDPSHMMNDVTRDALSSNFPNVNLYDFANDYVSGALISSDGKVSQDIPKSYADAEYLINIPVFKKHHRAGISVCSKNHFGSVSASMFHYSLPCPEAEMVTNGEYGVYRCFVDIMGHKDLGGKTLFYLVDGLWGSTNYSHPPVKFRMTPFNNDYPSSLFLSQDPVAVESVCFDFLYEEFDEDHPTEGGTPTYEKGPFPHFPGTDDFLHQAADPANWPADIEYDPENDGTILESLGAHEHWNNATDKLYSRNMGESKGIELVLKSTATSVSEQPISQNSLFTLEQNYPNPCVYSTTIKYELFKASNVNLTVYDLSGRKIISLVNEKQNPGIYEKLWDSKSTGNSSVSSGKYLYTLHVESDGVEITESKTIVVK